MRSGEYSRRIEDVSGGMCVCVCFLLPDTMAKTAVISSLGLETKSVFGCSPEGDLPLIPLLGRAAM